MAKRNRNIQLPCFGITINLIGDGSGSIISELKETCPYCRDINCTMNCVEFQEHCSDRDLEEQNNKKSERYEFLCHRAAVDAIESMVMAHAVAGIDVESPAYIEGIETTVLALTNADYSVEDVE